MAVDFHYLGKISFAHALAREAACWNIARASGAGTVLGFETGPVITLGARGCSEDVLVGEGWEVVNVERGGQATLHNPGQLVIFPVVNIREIGARRWVACLLDVTMATLREFGVESNCREGQPGLYTKIGKIASVGIRVRAGISTHGISINVCNDLRDFAAIVACGVKGAAVDRIGEDIELEEVFRAWMRNFSAISDSKLTTCSFLPNLEASLPFVRS